MEYPGNGLAAANSYRPDDIDYRDDSISDSLDIDALKKCDNPVFRVKCNSLSQVEDFLYDLDGCFPLYGEKEHYIMFDTEFMTQDVVEYPLSFLAAVGNEDPDGDYLVTVMMEQDVEQMATVVPLTIMCNLLELAEASKD